MHILHVLDHSIPLHSGYTFRTRAILREQQNMGWETLHLTSAKHQQEANCTVLEETVDGLKFFRTRTSDATIARMPVLGQWTIVKGLEKRLHEIIRKYRPDIIQAHSPALNGLAAIRAGRRQGLPVVYECRAFWEDAAVDHGTSREGGLRYRLTRMLETHVFKHADAITTICEGLRGDIIARGIPGEKITVVPNAVDIEKFSSTRKIDPGLAGELNLQGRPVIGFIGSFYAYEGLNLLIDAMPMILKAIPEARLLLVGGGPQDVSLRKQAKDSVARDAIHFTGRVPHQEVQRYYDLIDILAYPRLSMRLTDLVTPLKPLEAMAQGRLVIASDVGGHKELIQNGVNGVLFRADDAMDLAEAATDLFQDRDSWPGLAQRGRRFVESERNWKKSVSRYQGVYDGILKHRDHS